MLAEKLNIGIASKPAGQPCKRGFAHPRRLGKRRWRILVGVVVAVVPWGKKGNWSGLLGAC